MKNDKKEIGKRIRQIRKQLRLNQKEFGERLGVATSSVSAYESGETSPSFDTVVKIASMGKISIDDLLTGGTDDAPAYPDAYDIVKGQEEEEGIAPIVPLENDPLLNNVFASVDKLRQQLFRTGKSRPQVLQLYDGGDRLTDEEKSLLNAFRQLDGQRRKRLIEDAEDMLLAMKNREGKEA